MIRVLTAISVAYPSIGYTSGMNFLAGMLVTQLSEEVSDFYFNTMQDAFIGTVTLLERFEIKNVFSTDEREKAIKSWTHTLEQLYKREVPQVKKKLVCIL